MCTGKSLECQLDGVEDWLNAYKGVKYTKGVMGEKWLDPYGNARCGYFHSKDPISH